MDAKSSVEFGPIPGSSLEAGKVLFCRRQNVLIFARTYVYRSMISQKRWKMNLRAGKGGLPGLPSRCMCE